MTEGKQCIDGGGEMNERVAHMSFSTRKIHRRDVGQPKLGRSVYAIVQATHEHSRTMANPATNRPHGTRWHAEVPTGSEAVMHGKVFGKGRLPGLGMDRTF